MEHCSAVTQDQLRDHDVAMPALLCQIVLYYLIVEIDVRHKSSFPYAIQNQLGFRATREMVGTLYVGGNSGSRL